MNLKIIRISSSKKNHVLKKLCTVLRLTKIKFYIFINFLHFQGVISFNDFQNDNKKWLLKNRKSTRCWSWNDFSKAPKWCLAALLLVPHLKSCLKPKRVVWSFRDFRSKVFSVFMLCLHEFMWSCYWMRLSRFSSSFVFCSVCLTFHFFFFSSNNVDSWLCRVKNKKTVLTSWDTLLWSLMNIDERLWNETQDKIGMVISNAHIELNSIFHPKSCINY